ncbi:MAG: sigma-54 dependent transcriptional regulator [Nitrospirota bacterium]
MSKGKILVIDDEEEMLENYLRLLKKLNYDCIAQKDSGKAIKELELHNPDVILTDLRMSGKSGLEVLDAAKEINPETPVILITAYGDIPTAVESIKRGAFDFIAKPFSTDQLRIVLERAMKYKMLSDENKRLKEELMTSSMGELIGNSEVMREVNEIIKRVSLTDANILITGESGTGKEMVARLIHARSQRKSKPFIPVDCVALPENLLESELFGYEKGAFTGANTSRPGLLEATQGGTLFLDEVGEMPLTLQAKLLRTIQEREVRRLGSSKFIAIDIRIISATNRDLKKSVSEETFRDDLYYRLNVIRVLVPPLRNRREDIPLLALYFLHKFNDMHKKNVKGISSDAMVILENYSWPGNVRELQNVIERAVVMCDGEKINIRDLPEEIHRTLPPVFVETLPYKEAKEEWLAAFERNYLRALLNSTSVNISKAAEKAGINRKTIHRLIKRYKLDIRNKD